MLNPVTYTEAVVGDFLRYQLTTYPFADPHLFEQMRALLCLEQTRKTPLLQGPYISHLVATGTGSGKTECFLCPIISHCLPLRDRGARPGIVAVLVYPMNALAEDQLDRLRVLLAGSGVSFGMYVGKTPERTAEAGGTRLPAGSSRVDYLRAVDEAHKTRKTRHAVHPAEERVSREEMRTPGKQPRILLTNIKQLELLLTRQRDVELLN